MAEKTSEQMHWYLRRAGRVAGPLSSAKVRRLLLEDQVKMDDEVSRDRNSWQPVHAVAEVVPPQLRSGAQAAGSGTEKRSFPLLALIVSLVLLGGILGFAVWLGGSAPDESADCELAPAPGVDWQNCRLSGRELAGLDLRAARLQSADLSGASLAGADLRQAWLDYANLRQADMAYGIFSSASLRGADLRQADLSNASLQGADLRFADLRQARIGGADFTQADLANAIWLDGRTCAAGSKGECLVP